MVEKSIKLFQNKEIRTAWNEEEQSWYFSVSDVVSALTDSIDPKQYIKKMRSRDPELASKWGTICTPVEMPTADGKRRKISAADTQGILRLIQSIPSPKAEPFKMWLARIGSERLEEIADPEKAFERAVDIYRQKGYSEGWINQRMKSIEVRKSLTDEWDRTGIQKGLEYAVLTDEITRAWSGLTTREYKQLKNLKKESLRDNMTNLELVLNMLAEVSTTEISKANNPTTLDESKVIARQGGQVAGAARKNLEERIGKSVVTSLNATAIPVLAEIDNGEKPQGKKK